MKYSTLKLKPGREKSVMNRHPWIFSGGVDQLEAVEEGDIVEVQDSKKQLIGHGFYSKESQISCRMFSWGPAQDFEGKSYWMKKFVNALALRKALVLNSKTNSFRLIHAEGDFLPGLIVDIYDDLSIVQMLIEGVEKRKEIFKECLVDLGYKNIFERSSLSSGGQQDTEQKSGWLNGACEAPKLILENGFKFNVDFLGGQKTGFFLDQRDNRLLVQQHAKGKTALNAFSYTGGFSVYAAAGEAKEIHTLDSSKDAVLMADKNVKLNFPKANHQTLTKDCFEYIRGMEQDFYDLIILDPPAFAKNKHAVDKASRGYKDLNMKAIQKIKSGGLIFTFSCSHHISKDLFQKIVFAAAADAGRNVRIVNQLNQPADHPINIYHPEGEYLKGLQIWVE
jgi:23S rRNA (cytosine1962-C5)-methyltransferase